MNISLIEFANVFEKVEDQLISVIYEGSFQFEFVFEDFWQNDLYMAFQNSSSTLRLYLHNIIEIVKLDDLIYKLKYIGGQYIINIECK